MSDSRNDPQTDVNATAIILPIMTMVLILSIIPPAIILICVRIAHPEYFNRGEHHEETLPTTEQPIGKRAHHSLIYRRARAIALRFRGLAIVAGEAVALRSHETFEKDHGSRRCSHLPIMQNKSWHTLAESHTELTLTSSKDDGVERETVEMVETSKKPTKTIQFDLGNEENQEPSVQKPEPAVVAEVKT